MTARKYEFYARVSITINYECAQRTSEILFLPQEHEIPVLKPTCNVYFRYYIVVHSIIVTMKVDNKNTSQISACQYRVSLQIVVKTPHSRQHSRCNQPEQNKFELGLQRLSVTRALQRFFPISKTFWWTSIKCIHDNNGEQSFRNHSFNVNSQEYPSCSFIFT